MNLLAHALLSPDGSEVLFGNLTADWVKGRARTAMPPGVQRGMRLHQKIDTFTDVHVLVGRCAGLLSPVWGRYAEILVDVMFDHVLSAEWGAHCGEAREVVIGRAYGAVREWKEVLPERAKVPAEMLLAEDWLTSYATLDGLRLTFTRMSRRLSARGHEVELGPAAEDFVTHREAFHAAFAEFFPALRGEVERWEEWRVG